MSDDKSIKLRKELDEIFKKAKELHPDSDEYCQLMIIAARKIRQLPTLNKGNLKWN